MIFPASAIPSLVDFSTGPFSLRSVDGDPLGLITDEYLRCLIQASVVSAVGSRTRIKYFCLNFPQQEVDDILGIHARIIRSRSPADMIRALVAGRATIYRQKLAVVQPDGRTRRCVVFQHKGGIR